MIAGVFVVAGWTPRSEIVRYTFTEESEVRVEGTSSLHDWSAEGTSIAGMMEITGGGGLLDGGTLTKGNLTIPVGGLDTDNNTMNKKMRAALKADTYSTITYQLVSATVTGAPEGNSVQILATGELTLAGVSKTIEVKLDGHDLGGGKLRLIGSYALQMTEYGMKPPSAMLGTIKTGDMVTIHFDLIANAL
jgi:polyisoprenoid-binding protein YceI